MKRTRQNRRWVFAVMTAVLFPALAFHASCIAVMGPGAWGSGLEEADPERHEPTELIRRYAAELADRPSGDFPDATDLQPPPDAQFEGKIRQSYIGSDQAVYLTAEGDRWTDRQHLYLRENSSISELSLETAHTLTRPRILRRQVLYERWDPWAVSATQKIRRYISSWVDETKQPEASLYVYDPAAEQWNFVMPGHTLVPSPDGSRAVLLRSGAMAAGYYSIHVWVDDESEPRAILSLREADEGSGRSFVMRWTSDSAAIQVVGRTGGFARRKREPSDFDLIYVVDEEKMYDLGGTS